MSKNKPDLEGVLSTEQQLIGEVGSTNIMEVSITATGPRGREGLDAYEVWLRAGNVGTEADFLNSLAADNDANFIHKQIPASSEWVIEHSLQKFSSIVTVDSANSVVMGDIEYIDENTIIVRFNGEFSGFAYLN